MSKKSILTLVILAIVVTGAIVFRFKYLPQLTVSVPEYQEPGKLVELEQNWTREQRTQFHYTAQGTRLIPYAWFMALEQPCFSIGACEPFSSQKYLGRFGFLAGKPDASMNPDGLPVGFAVQKDFHDPVGPNSVPTLGLTCAACHTGQVRYHGYDVRVEGAPAMIEVTQFQKALGLALAFTTKLPPFKWTRYARFEAKVLGPNATEAQKTKLKDDVAAFMAPLLAEKDTTDARHTYDNQAGFVRTDALTRIGNQVFAVDMKIDNNFAAANAPVRFPQIWDASWFDWIQYNSSISDPMVRNIGEALGVRAAAKLYGANAGDFDSSVDVKGVWELETLLAGSAPFQGLSSPRWPFVFPALDQKKVEKGAVLYQKYCASCHLPPVNELATDLHSPSPMHWRKNALGAQFIALRDIPVEEIGTDRHEAMDFISRTADPGALGKQSISAESGLNLVTLGIRQKYYEKMQFPPAMQLAWNGRRDPADAAVRAPAMYKARPLNGIWAVSPYLHNGSVPDLYALLSPSTENERPNKFWVGSEMFDPKRVGHDLAEFQGGTLFDVSLPGNSNKGHEFKDGPAGNGVIGPTLSPDDRWALIEYLKSL